MILGILHSDKTIHSASTVLALEFVENIDDTTFALGMCCFYFGETILFCLLMHIHLLALLTQYEYSQERILWETNVNGNKPNVQPTDD